MNTEQLNELCEQWQDLTVKIDTDDFFDLDLFCSSFSKTFKVLQPLAKQEAVPKDLMQLLFAAHCFAEHGVSGYCKEHDAAVDLTGKMLVDCSIVCADRKLVDTFDFELQKYIPYADANAAVAMLAEKYAADYE